MNIKEKPATWNKERPLFEADFIQSHLLPFFNFNENTGDYEIKSEFAEDEDRKVAFETLNTGWAMWLRAKRGAKAEIEPIFDIFHVGSDVRNIRTLQANIENSSRRSNCLSRIEGIITETLISDEPESYGEEYQESLLNWGESPDQYESRFKSIWDAKQSEIDELKAKLEKAQATKQTYFLKDADYVVDDICDYDLEPELGEVFEFEKWNRSKEVKVYVVPIFKNEDEYEFVEFSSENEADKAAAENKAMIEAAQGEEE